MKLEILLLLILTQVSVFALDPNLAIGEKFCKQNKIDSAMHYFDLVEDEVTIKTTIEDVFYKNYFSAKCYDQLEANKSAEYYYRKSLRIMDSTDIREPDLYLNLSNYYERTHNYKEANNYLNLYYEDKLEYMNQEINATNGRLARLDSLETQTIGSQANEVKLKSDIRLLIVLISVIGLGFLAALIIILRNKKNLNRKE